MEDLWFEKYRPKKISDYIWESKQQQNTVESWVKNRNIGTSLLSGHPGVGKSSLINVLLNELDVHKGDILMINASSETSVEMVREKIMNFVPTIAWGDFKIVILEEADALSKSAQQSLKWVIEEFSSTVRFLITTNHPHKIDPAIQSRCQKFHIEKLSEEGFLSRMMYILEQEGIEYTDEILISYFKATYPDMRQAINVIEKNSSTGKLAIIEENAGTQAEIFVRVVELMKSKKVQEARETLINEASQDDYIEIYRFLYRNLDLWSTDSAKQDECLVIIRDGIYKDNFVADREINLSATLAELSMIYESK